MVATLEVVINRVAVPMLRPAHGTPPLWHTLLDYAGLFLFYFAGTLAAVLLGARVVSALAERRGVRDVIAHVAVAVAAVLAAIPLVITVPASISFALELAFAAAVLALVASAFGRGRDLGAQLGVVVLAVPLLVHGVAVIGARWFWPDGAFDGPGVTVAHAGALALCFSALLSPYVFAPRPFARAVTRPVPILLAMTLAAMGAVAARLWYAPVAHATKLAIGVELDTMRPDPRLALFLLGIATIVWTLASCALSGSAARRRIGTGIAFVVLGGYAFRWPHHYLLPLLGLALVAEAVRDVRDEELAALPIAGVTPPVGDAPWAAYMTALTSALKRTLAGVQTLTTKGEEGAASSIVVAEKDGLPVRLQLERIDGSVLAFDIVIGREVDAGRAATLVIWAIPPRGQGVNPSGPPAAPQFKVGDEAFDERFRCRGSKLAFERLLDEGLRARAVATLDGWLAYWDPASLRYRVYPGRGAPLDHPVPLSDLALGRPATPDRLVAVIELLVEIAARGVAVPPAEPAADVESPAGASSP